MSTVQGPAIPSYRRQHCGHGIGLDVYEPPIINESTDEVLEVGMTFCFETPHYQIGGGGMMVEDTLVITEGGHRRFTITDRNLRVIPA
jgi:Xaa-Pro aminopeptidase